MARLHTQAWGVDLGKVGVGEGSSAHFRPATCIAFPASGPQVAQQHPQAVEDMPGTQEAAAVVLVPPTFQSPPRCPPPPDLASARNPQS